MKTIEEKIQQAWEQLENTTRASENFKQGFIAGYTEANKWISVEEELPDKNKRVLIKTNSGLIYVGFWNGTNFCEMFGCHPIDMITHWKPIN